MKLRSTLLVVGGMLYASLGIAVGAFAAGPPTYSDLYYSADPKAGMRVPPSGAINILPNRLSDGIVTTTFVSTTAPVGEVSNTLGCGGVGQGEFTSGLFNMPETFQKFQQDVNSTLSKDLLSLNFVMPQTSALFDQLNSIGNQRYDQFQRGCTVTQLQQDARQNYLQACVADVTPERKEMIDKDNKARAKEHKIPEDQIGPMAYAQAWEVCSNQYISNTTAFKARNEKLVEFSEKIREAERVDKAIRPYLCGTMSDMRNEDEKDNADNGCWAVYLIPQVRSCIGHDLEGSCTNGDYGVRQPMIPMPRLFDTYRFIMEDELVARRVVSLTTQLAKLKIDASTLKNAASDAVLSMSAGTIARNKGADEKLPEESIPDKNKPKLVVRDFQLDYLNCRDADVMSPVQRYVDALVRRSKVVEDAKPSIRYTNPEYTFGEERYQSVVDQMKLPETDGPKGDSDINLDRMAFVQMLHASLGCTVNQSVPIFDPNIIASLQTQCTTQDRSAFYAMASYDVSVAATRDVYRFLALKLKQTYARLLTEAMIPVSDTTKAVTPTLSPELNSKFAAVVKDVMIPYVESQIQRLDELSNTRGAFGQRVSDIYKRKDGCISTERSGLFEGSVRQ